ncbi:LOW QUALITY PROTEIN: protein yellow-like [Homalodisca vitripennis]|uniref:LOW QUALITY PROTEIN: protein yellow-like n=1 Tax=Homalodisca vitripennis TaxID=197043 RepID=UPI001EEBCDC1|nr:LOW QUALITY PROTEIN: protein yellow-like [Homalodisca vitripennis]
MLKLILLLTISECYLTATFAHLQNYPNNPGFGRPSRPGFGGRPPPPQGYGGYEESDGFIFEENINPNRPPVNPNPVNPNPVNPNPVYPNPVYPNRPTRNPMQVMYSWREVDFTFPNQNARDNLITTKLFIPRNNLILDVDVYDERPGQPKVFVTLPRVRPGVPVTLATVTSQRRNGSNLLEPFPDWQSNTPGSCDTSLTSVFRTHIDDCGRLWVLDSGNNNAFGGTANPSRIVCPPQIVIYDLRNNNRLVGKFRIPSSMIENNTLLVTIAVDTRQRDCSDAYAYIADSIAYKMIVFNLRNRQFWRINSILFFPYPDYSTFTVNGVSFDLMGGIFGLAIGPPYRNNRRLYFHCIDSVKQSWVETADLRNQSLWQNNMNAAPRAFHLFNGTRSSQSAAATMTKDGIMFFGLIGSNEIACWDSRTRFTRSNLVSLAKDDTALQFNSGIKVYGNKLYAATSRLQNYITNRISENEDNYRVLVGDLQEMTRGTQCQVDYKQQPL